MMKRLSLMASVAMLASCTQQEAAPIEFRGGYFYGMDGVVNTKGDEQPKYSAENPAELGDDVAYKYSADDAEVRYGIPAEIPEVETRDLSTPSSAPSQTVASKVETEPKGFFARLKSSASGGMDKVKKWRPLGTTETAAPKVAATGASATVVQPVVPSLAPAVEAPVKTVAIPKLAAAPIVVPAPDKIEVIETSPKVQPEVKIEAPPVTVASLPPAQEAPSAVTPHPAKKFVWPLKGKVLAGFGDKAETTGKPSDGVYLSARKGSPIRSAADGIVIYTGDKLPSYGNLILVKHADGYVSAYGHTSDTVVKKGEYVVGGQLIGFAGNSGGVKRPQLYFGIRKNKTPINPMGHLK